MSNCKRHYSTMYKVRTGMLDCPFCEILRLRKENEAFQIVRDDLAAKLVKCRQENEELRSRCSLLASANEVQAERAEKAEAENKLLLGLLRVARCPNCDGSGVYGVPNLRGTGETDGMGYEITVMEQEPVQCEWCAVRQQALKEE